MILINIHHTVSVNTALHSPKAISPDMEGYWVYDDVDIEAIIGKKGEIIHS